MVDFWFPFIRPVQEGIECMGNYSQSCFTPLFQEVFDMVMAEPKKYQSLMCTHGTDERSSKWNNIFIRSDYLSLQFLFK